MIDNAAFLSEGNKVWLSCTYCWTRHTAYRVDGRLFISGFCGHDPRRYFLDTEEYHQYVDRYRKEGGKHIHEWDAPEQEALPLFDETG
jgi:hypothetical protein